MLLSKSAIFVSRVVYTGNRVNYVLVGLSSAKPFTEVKCRLYSCSEFLARKELKTAIAGIFPIGYFN